MSNLLTNSMDDSKRTSKDRQSESGSEDEEIKRKLEFNDEVYREEPRDKILLGGTIFIINIEICVSYLFLVVFMHSGSSWRKFYSDSRISKS